MRNTRVLFALTPANLVLLTGLTIQSLTRPARAQGDGGVQLFGRDEGSVVRVVSKAGERRELAP